MVIQTIAIVLGLLLLVSSAAILAWGFPRLPARHPQRLRVSSRH